MISILLSKLGTTMIDDVHIDGTISGDVQGNTAY